MIIEFSFKHTVTLKVAGFLLWEKKKNFKYSSKNSATGNNIHWKVIHFQIRTKQSNLSWVAVRSLIRIISAEFQKVHLTLCSHDSEFWWIINLQTNWLWSTPIPRSSLLLTPHSLYNSLGCVTACLAILLRLLQLLNDLKVTLLLK